MSREAIEAKLVQAEGHVSIGLQNVARQWHIVAELARNGHDTTKAEDLLNTFLESQRLHELDRDRLLDELAKTNLGRD